MADSSETYWERVAESRWGRYLTDAEERMLAFGCELAGQPGVALEVGCEGGRWSAWLAERGWRLVCTDTDSRALALCQRRLPDARCVLAQADERRIPVEDRIADLLLVYEVDPVTSADWFPAEAARVLRPGGVLVATFHNPASPRAVAYRALQRVDPKRRAHGFYRGPTYRQLRQTLELCGFHFERQQGVGWGPFTRQSDSPLIPAWTAAEKALGLGRLHRFSPLVIGAAVLRA